MADAESKRFLQEIEPCLDRLYRAAYRLTHNRADAEELFQETCTRAFERRHDWQELRSTLGWLMRVQYNLFVDELRRRKAAVVVPIGDVGHEILKAGEPYDPESSAIDAETMAQIQRAWLHLKREQRALIALRVEGYTLPEIQGITGLSLAAINSRLQRARQALARHLAEDDVAGQAPMSMEIKR